MDEIYEEIAARQNGVYEHQRSSVIFVTIFSDDLELLRRWRVAVGNLGRVIDNIEQWGTRGDTRSPANRAMGSCAWNMRGYHAYVFCIGIRSHLLKHDPMRYNRCQLCIEAYENRSDRQAAGAQRS